jgi:hypothetical protein
MSRHQNARPNHYIKIANRSFENCPQFKYLGTKLPNQKLIQEEIKRRLNLGNSIQNLLSSRLLSKNIKIRILTLSVVLYGCETWFLTLRKKHTLRVFEDRVLRRIFGPKRDGVMGGWRRLHNEEFITRTLLQV